MMSDWWFLVQLQKTTKEIWEAEDELLVWHKSENPDRNSFENDAAMEPKESRRGAQRVDSEL